MTKPGDSIIAELNNAIVYTREDQSRGRERLIRVLDNVDIKAIRRRLGLTQAEFAHRYGFELGSIRNWEQGRRRPEGPARVLLHIIEKEPKAVQRALAG